MSETRPLTKFQKVLVGLVAVMSAAVVATISLAVRDSLNATRTSDIKITTVCDTVIWQQNLVPYTGEPYHYGYEVVVQISHGQYVNLLVPRDSAGPIVGKLYLFTVVDGRPDGRFLPWKDCKELPFRSTAP